MTKRRVSKGSTKNQSHQPKKTHLKGPIWLILKIGSVIAFVVGLAASVVTFLPRVTVESGASIDPSNPYPIPFVITNTGIVPLTNVQPAIGLCAFWTGDPPQIPPACDGSLHSRLVMPKWLVRELRHDEKHMIRLDDLFAIKPPAKFGGADISIVITYYPWLIPIKREVEFRFITHKENNAMLSWVPQPLGK